MVDADLDKFSIVYMTCTYRVFLQKIKIPSATIMNSKTSKPTAK